MGFIKKDKSEAGAVVGNGAAPAYSFDFIAQSFGLFAINGQAFNLAAIGFMEHTETGAALVIHGGTEIELTHDDLAEIERTIRARIEAHERAKNVAGGKSDLIIPNFSMKAN